MSNVSGTYAATTLTTTTDGATTNQLVAGAFLTITLLPNGTTTGRFFVPGGAEGGGDLDADMAGTWTLTESTVVFAQTADTFVRDMAFTASRDRLSGEETWGSYTVRVTLNR
jgi:hypothetical protein